MNRNVLETKGCERGFTIVELLIVIAIIGILAAIAVPAYVGQREKAKATSIESSAKGAVSEIQGILDSFVYEEPYLLLNAAGQVICVQSSKAAGSACQALYNENADHTYTIIDDVVSDILNHYVGRNVRSPFNYSQYLFVNTPNKTIGTVVIEAIDTRSIRIHAYAEDISMPFFDTLVTAR